MRVLAYILTVAVAFAAKPAQPVSLKSSQLEVTFDPLKGLPVEYRLAYNKATLRGGVNSEVTATIFRADQRRYTNYAIRPEIIRAIRNRADFQFTVREKGVSMASFLVRYELTGAEILVSLEAVFEEQGFELINVGLPQLASVHEEDGGAWLAHGDGGGTAAMLKNAKDGHISGGAVLPVVMIGSNRMLCVEEVLSPGDTTELAVDHHQANLGTVKVWRTNGDTNALIGGRPLSRLSFAGDMDHNGVVDWLDGAKLVRGRIPEIPSHANDDKVMYFADRDADKVAQRARMLTGGAPQMVMKTADELRFATLGRMAVYAVGQSGETSPFGGEPIPLVAAIYRKAAIWGMHGDDWKKQPELFSFFYNGHEFPRLPAVDWERQFVSFYYGILVPWYQVHYRNIESYLHDGDRTVLTLEGNSKIDLDWKSDQYSITVAGAEVARDGDTFCPIGQDRVGFYSKSAKTLSAPLPEGWDANAVAAVTLPVEKTEAARVTVREGKLTVSVQAERPVLVFQDAQALRRATR